MIATTDEQRKTPPDDVWAKSVCLIGFGAETCRYLTMGASGWGCAKLSSLRPIIDARADMRAKGDNCEGRA
jgi:hypothetical protein